MIKKYKLLILDLDGTVYLNDKPLHNCIYYLNMYTTSGGKLIFLTNNTSVEKAIYLDKLKGLGLKNLTKNSIISPTDVFLNYCIVKEFKTCLYLTTQSTLKYIQNNNGPKLEYINPDIVLIGFDKELSYEKLINASECINQGTPYYLTNIDLSCPTTKGPIPDCGAIGKLLQLTTGMEQTGHFGKPGKLMVHELINKIKALQVNLNQVALVGDRYYTDIALGNSIGIDTVHVQTGEKSEVDIMNIPTYEFNSLTDFLIKILNIDR